MSDERSLLVRHLIDKHRRNGNDLAVKSLDSLKTVHVYRTLVDGCDWAQVVTRLDDPVSDKGSKQGI